MRLVYLIPAQISKRSYGKEEMVRRERWLQELAPAAVNVSVTDIQEGPLTIESEKDEEEAMPYALRRVMELKYEGVDGILLGCFSDLGLAEMQTAVAIPVIGPGRSSFARAAAEGRCFGAVTVTESAIPLIRRVARGGKVEERLIGVEAISMAVMAVSGSRAAVVERCMNAAKRLVDEGAKAIVLACMSFGFMGLADDMSSLGVPVICPLTAGMEAASKELFQSKAGGLD